MQQNAEASTYKMKKCKSAKVTNYKMRKYTRKYFRSLFTFTAVGATSDASQTGERLYDVHPSAELQPITNLLDYNQDNVLADDINNFFCKSCI